MYDTSDLVNLFLKDPRVGPNLPAKPFTREDKVYQVRENGRLRFFNLEYRETSTRKLFLDTHKRFYLVVCEVHCETLGFPSVNRQAICEAGFVVRRRRADGRRVFQRWVPTSNEDGKGDWIDTPDERNVPDETIYPLQPLIPDPRLKDHPAAGRTIYFGLVPTANTHIDRLEQPQFDDDSLYEIRCFVRRHKEPCPRKSTRADCPGPLFWSEPTEPYQIAAPFDLIGTSYRTINVKMPDLRALKAQAATPRIGLRAPVRFNLPPASGVEVSAPSLPIPGGPKLMGGVCFRNIPLTTIVAMFAYNILKPIVVRIFQLYYLEPLEFCIATPSDLPSPSLIVSPSLPPMPPIGLTDPTNPFSPLVDIQSVIENAKAEVGAVGSLEQLKAAKDEVISTATRIAEEVFL